MGDGNDLVLGEYHRADGMIPCIIQGTLEFRGFISAISIETELV